MCIIGWKKNNTSSFILTNNKQYNIIYDINWGYKMNGWNRVNKHRYELIYNNKPYLTAVYYRTPYEDTN